MIRCDSPLHHLTLIPSVSISTATTCTILSIIITITNPYLAFRQPLPRWIFGPYYSKKIGFLWYCFRIFLLEKVIIIPDSHGAPAYHLSKSCWNISEHISNIALVHFAEVMIFVTSTSSQYTYRHHHHCYHHHLPCHEALQGQVCRNHQRQDMSPHSIGARPGTLCYQKENLTKKLKWS